MTEPLHAARIAAKFAAPDPSTAADWYQSALNFPKKAIFEGGGYAIVARGDIEIHLWQCGDRTIAENTACYITVSSVGDLNALHAEWLLASKQAAFHPGRIEDEPMDKPGHGMREFHVWDPAGNLMGIGADL